MGDVLKVQGRGGVTILRGDGSEECLLGYDSYDFEWQETCALMESMVVLPGMGS